MYIKMSVEVVSKRHLILVKISNHISSGTTHYCLGFFILQIMQNFIQEFKFTGYDEPKTISFKPQYGLVIITIHDLVRDVSVQISLSKNDGEHILKYFNESLSLIKANGNERVD